MERRANRTRECDRIMKSSYFTILIFLLACLIFVTSASALTQFQTGTTGTATSSSHTSSYVVANMFDGSSTTFWSSQMPGVMSEWVVYDFNSTTTHRVSQYVLQARNSAASTDAPTAWYFQGSTDNTNWYFLDRQTGVSWTDGEIKTYSSFTQSVNISLYRYYRLYITAGGSDVNTCQLAQEQFWGSDSSVPVSSFTPSGVTTGTSPLTVTLTDTSTNTPTYWNWSLQGYGTNTTHLVNWSTSQNTVGTFTAGNFSISLGAGNSQGFNLSTQITWINVTNPIPIVSFTASNTSGILPLIVAFSDTSTGNMTSRFWDFGDVTNSTNASPVKTYSTAGTYTVNLTETNLDVSNSTTKTINVYNPANSQFSSFNTAGTAPFSTYLYDLSTNTTPGTDTWYWMFGDGNTSTAQSLYYTWNITGTYAINHSFSNGVSTSWINKSAYIVVGTPTPPVVAPVASFYGGPQIGAPPLLVYLTDVSSNTPTSWNWSFGDGTYGITQNPSHWYNSSGFFTVGLTATNTAGSNTTSQNNFIMVY